jgi:hypothetical protein
MDIFKKKGGCIGCPPTYGKAEGARRIGTPTCLDLDTIDQKRKHGYKTRFDLFVLFFSIAPQRRGNVSGKRICNTMRSLDLVK